MAQQNVEVKIVGKDQASREILGVGNALERMKISVESNRTGLARLDGALKDSARNFLGLQGNAGRLASALLSFSPQGLVVTAVIAGIAAMIKNTIDLAAAQEELQKQLTNSKDKYIEQLAATKAAVAGLSDSVAGEKMSLDDRAAANEKQQEQIKAEIALIQERANARFEEIKRFGLGQAQFNTGARLAQSIIQDLNVSSQGFFTNTRNAFNVMLEMQNPAQALQQSEVRLTTLQTERLKLIEEQAGIAKERQALADSVEKTTADRLAKDKKATEDAAKAEEDRIKKREQAILDEISQFEQLFTIRQQGLFVTAAEQEQLNTKLADFKKLAEDVNQSLNIRIQAMQVVISTENSLAQVQEENARKEKERQDEVTQMLRERQELQKQVFDRAVEDQQWYLDNIRTGAMLAADAFMTMFSVIGQGGNALRNLGRGFGQLLSGLARTKVAENIAYAVENLAKAIGNTAIGNLPGAALNKAAATQHFKAAALWGVLGGGAAAAGGGGLGGVGGAGGFSNSNLGGTGGGGAPIFITITGGGILDMNNPEVARSFVNALNTATNRRAIITTTGR